MIKKSRELRELLGHTIRLAENYHQEPRGVLKITSSTIIAKRYLQPVINDFQKRFPQVEVELRLDDRVMDIVAEGVDLAFRVGEPKDSTLIARKLARNRSRVRYVRGRSGAARSRPGRDGSPARQDPRATRSSAQGWHGFQRAPGRGQR